MQLIGLPPPTEGIKLTKDNISAFIQNRCIGCGKLYIAESRLCFVKDGNSEGLSLQYQHIGVFAISHDTEKFQHPCIFLMLDYSMQEQENGINSDEEQQNGDQEVEKSTVVRFVSENVDELQPIYDAISQCQELHPSSDVSDAADSRDNFFDDPYESHSDDDDSW